MLHNLGADGLTVARVTSSLRQQRLDLPRPLIPAEVSYSRRASQRRPWGDKSGVSL